MDGLKRLIINRIILPLIRFISILKYRLLSTATNIEGKPVLYQPLLANGRGLIQIKGRVVVGIVASPGNLNTYAYFDARGIHTKIIIEDGVWINNNSCLISEGEGIIIRKNTLIGPNFSAFDSDFHELAIDKRMGGCPRTGLVEIGENVFIGANVTILKGVKIGKNSVIGSGSVVTKSIPDNVIAGGNPCKVIKSLDD